MRHLRLLAATLVGFSLTGLVLAGAQSREGGRESIRWIRDWKQGVELAARTGRPILLDFWCGT
jgi:hypothetical protein